jgi:outer membrane protein TolC
MKKSFVIPAIYFCCICHIFLLAEEKPLVLTELIAEAYTRNPKIKVMEKETQAYSFRIKPAQTLPDPMVEISFRNMGLDQWMLGKDPDSGIMFSYAQVFPLFGKLKLAGDIARKAYEGRRQAAETVKIEIARDIKMAYFDLYYLQKAIEIFEKQKNLMQKTLALTEIHYSVGSGIQNDIFKAQLEITRMDEMIIPMKEMIKMKIAAINFLLDYPAAHPLGKIEKLDEITLTFTLPQLEEMLIKQLPQLKEAYIMAEERSLVVQMARKEFTPDLTVRLGWEYKGKLTDMYELMLGMEIPLFTGRKQQNRLREARAMAQSAQFDIDAMRNDMLSEMNEYYFRAKTSENLVQLYKTQFLPQSRLAFEASFAAYPVNKTDFMSLISDISALFTAEIAYHRELSEFWKNLAALEALVGGALFEKTTPPTPPAKAFNKKE